ncbi:MAG: molybdate ABC transporter substrate-binding protein [Sphingomonadaceae bacterium]|jgi:molybdate transport system substrate-binding protein
MRGLLARLLCAILLPLLAASCAPARDKGPLVFAPSSLTEALEDVADAWAAKRHPRPVLAFAGTAANARQIEAGAPGDLFLSADEQWMNEVARKGLIDARSRASIAANRLVLIAPADSTDRLDIAYEMPLEATLGGGKLAIADPDAVPSGRYARQALVRLNAWPRRKSALIRTENVRVALALVARGEARFGIVYATDAASEPDVRVLGTFPESAHVPIRYPAALLKTSQHPDARAFLAFLQSSEAQAIFRKHGFLPGGGA